MVSRLSGLFIRDCSLWIIFMDNGRVDFSGWHGIPTVRWGFSELDLGIILRGPQVDYGCIGIFSFSNIL